MSGPAATREETNRAEWEDPRNWHTFLGIYRSTRDSRAVVPKRNPAFGWTFNAGHPLGLALTVLSLAVLVGGIVLGLGGIL